MKNLFIIVVILLATACSTVKPAASGNNTSAKSPDVTFLDNISITPGSSKSQSNNSSAGKNIYPVKAGAKDVAYPATIENYSPLQFKYAILTNTSVEQMSNEKLLSFMDEWYGVPYHYGGTTKDGIDCSAFVSLLMSSVYSITDLPRMARDQYISTKRIREDDLQEGDLVFFHTLGKKKSVTHVGVYLCNNKFVHASVSGVMISDLGEGYYAQHYVGAGRVKVN